MAIINGTSGNNLLLGTLLNDLINGGAGHDTLYGFDGNDTLDGGSGNDLLYGGIGNDWMMGGSGVGSDTMYGEEGNDRVDGGSGNDVLHGGTGNDTVLGGSGNDLMTGDTGSQSFGANLVTNGSFEADAIVDHSGQWQIYPAGLTGWTTSIGDGPELQKIIPAADGTQYLELDSNNNSNVVQNIATGGTGAFLLEFAYSPRAGAGAASNPVEVYWNGVLLDTLTGATEAWTTHSYAVNGAGATTALEFRAAGTSDSLGGFIDKVSVRSVDDAGNDNLDGGSGNDMMSGGYGNDVLLGQSGNDSVDGGTGNDVVSGHSGFDTLLGGDGDDTLTGHSGADTLTGGSGDDVYLYTALADSTTSMRDTITGWESGQDLIDLSGLGFTGIAAGAPSGTVLGYAHVSGNTVITATGSDFSIALTGTHTLTNTDFDFV